jgi:putative transposase
MRTGRPKTTLTMSGDERTHLLAITRSRSLPAALTLRAKIVLACEREPSNAVVATRLGVGPHTIGKWRNRFITDRIEGLYDEMRSGRPRTVEDEAVAELITKTLARKPKAATHWSVRAIAKETGIAKSTVHRLFQLFGLQPHRTRSFKLSTDPFFVEKLRDVVGLYLNPPDKAVVLCVDEKSQIQALERTQPMLPMGFGYIEGVTHDYQRHGTTTLFAALNVLDGAVIAQCKPRHRHQEFLAFLRHIEANVPAQLDVHLVVDNYATHKHPKVRAWLARRPRWHIHFTPTYASWLNQVERFFALITQRAIRRGSFDSKPTLSKKSIASSAFTMQIHDPSCGPLPLTPSSRNSRDFVSEFPGQNTTLSRTWAESKSCYAGARCFGRAGGQLPGSRNAGTWTHLDRRRRSALWRIHEETHELSGLYGRSVSVSGEFPGLAPVG